MKHHFDPGEWMIHDGPSTSGDRSFIDRAVRLVESTNTHYVVEHTIVGDWRQTVLCKKEWSKFVPATEQMKQMALSKLHRRGTSTQGKGGLV